MINEIAKAYQLSEKMPEQIKAWIAHIQLDIERLEPAAVAKIIAKQVESVARWAYLQGTFDALAEKQNKK